jgi:protein-S-isoprenylcysteine O-methyltransferase Ste14
MRVAGAVVVASWISFFIVWIVFAVRAKRTVSRRRGGGIALLRLFVVLIALRVIRLPHVAWVAALEGRMRTHLAILAVGAALCVAGIGWAIWARVHIGRNWGMPMSLKESPELVTSGPYRLVRHPIYTGILVAFLGTALVAGFAWIGVFLVSTAYFVYSARAEEALMRERFPDAYPAYARETKMLIPFVL